MIRKNHVFGTGVLRHDPRPARVLILCAWLVAGSVGAAGPAVAQPSPAPAAPATPAAIVGHDIKLATSDSAGVGQTRSLSLTIAPRPGHVISQDGPLRIDVSAEPPAGIELAKKRYERRDAADAQAEAPRFDIRYRAAAPGEHAVLVDMRFWVCGRHTCWPVREQRSVRITSRAAER